MSEIINDTTCVLEGVEPDSDETEAEEEQLDELSDCRILRTDNGKAAVFITNKSVVIGSGTEYIYVGKNGTTIDGQIHLSNAPGEIRVNGFWVFNNDMLTTVPSTTYTPIPTLKFKESEAAKEIQNLVKNLMELIPSG